MNPEEYPFYKWDVFKTKHFIFGQDWEVPIPGFFIVEPKRKTIKSILDMTKGEYSDFTAVLLKGRKLMKEALGIEIVYLFQEENGKHFHVWVFPWYQWMDKFGKSVEAVRPIMQYAIKNMMTEKDIAQVKGAVEKSIGFLKKN
jgi:diadenosine tetraphosphate (Ap4A) HIT family hydrolase